MQGKLCKCCPCICCSEIAFLGPTWRSKQANMGPSWAQDGSFEASWRPLGGQVGFCSNFKRSWALCWAHVGGQNDTKWRFSCLVKRTSVTRGSWRRLELGSGVVLAPFWRPKSKKKACLGKWKIRAWLELVLVRRRSKKQRISEPWNNAEKTNSSGCGAFFAPCQRAKNKNSNQHERKPKTSEKRGQQRQNMREKR